MRTTAAGRAARNQFIKICIEEGSRGAVEAAAVRDQLQKDVDAARAAYIEAATMYAASYEADVKRAALELEKNEGQLAAVLQEIADARDNIENVERCGTADKVEQLRRDLQGIEKDAAELRKRSAELGQYQPAGDPELLRAAEIADKRWRSEKGTADKIASGIDKTITDKAAELRQAQAEIRAGVWSAVIIPGDIKISELRRKGKDGHQLRDILQNREKTAAVIKAIRDRINKAPEIRTNEEDRAENTENTKNTK